MLNQEKPQSESMKAETSKAASGSNKKPGLISSICSLFTASKVPKLVVPPIRSTTLLAAKYHAHR